MKKLNKRGEDILMLADFFLKHFSALARRRTLKLTAAARKRLIAHAWPGNIRELRNVIERAIILCSGDRIHASDLPLSGSESWQAEPKEDGEQFLSIEEVETLHIQRVLAATGQNLSRGAEILGVTRTTLYNKLRKYQLNKPE